jgi:Carboxypeptidase regulatory-like domain
MMRCVRSASTGALILLAAGLFPRQGVLAQARPIPNAATATATITGTVVDEAGLSVDSAVVSIIDARLSVVTIANGSFRLAGVSPGKAHIVVRKLGFDPLELDFEIAAGVTAALRLTIVAVAPPMTSDTALNSAAVDSTAATNSRTSTLVGAVVDADGAPLFGATVEEAASSTRTMTDSAGRFRLQGLQPGLSFVRVRKVGYLPEYFSMTAIAGRNINSTIRLTRAGPTLAKVEVRDDALRSDTKLRGFYERAAKGGGVFIERSEILKRNATQLSDILRGRNGITVYGQSAGGSVIAGRGFRLGGGQAGAGICPLPLILDGVNVPLRDGLTIDRVVSIQDVRAIEVYTSGPSVPAELANGSTDCGAVVIWTR